MDGQDFLKHCFSKPKSLGDLPIGSHFICFPTDGDDSGHGGFKGGARVKTKIAPYHPGVMYHETYRNTCVPYGADIHDAKNHECLPLRVLIIQVFF